MTRIMSLALATVLVAGSAVKAEDSNQGEVRQNIENGGWKVAYGRMVTEAEYAKLTAAIAASIATENPGLVLAYLEDFAASTVDKIAGQVPEISRQILIEQVKKAITTKGGSLSHGRVDIKFGVATYQRWQRTVHHEPRPKWKWVKTPFGKKKVPDGVELVAVEHRIPLPNWHQPYVAIRVRN